MPPGTYFCLNMLPNLSVNFLRSLIAAFNSKEGKGKGNVEYVYTRYKIKRVGQNVAPKLKNL